MLHSGYQEFLSIIDVLLFEGATIPPNVVEISQKMKEGLSFSLFKMLKSGYEAFIDITDMLLFKVATFLPNLVKIGPNMSERHQFSNFKMAAIAMLDSGYQAFSIS